MSVTGNKNTYIWRLSMMWNTHTYINIYAYVCVLTLILLMWRIG